MQGLINFSEQCALVILILLPSFFYAFAIGFFLASGWGFWQQAQSHNPFRAKPWLPILAMLMSGLCASFPTILTLFNISAGSDIVVSVSGELTTYDDITAPPSILGATVGDTVLNIVTVFQHFFQAVGVLSCFVAVIAWWHIQKGTSNRSAGGCAVQFVFGILLINVLTVSGALVTVFAT